MNNKIEILKGYIEALITSEDRIGHPLSITISDIMKEFQDTFGLSPDDAVMECINEGKLKQACESIHGMSSSPEYDSLLSIYTDLTSVFEKLVNDSLFEGLDNCNFGIKMLDNILKTFLVNRGEYLVRMTTQYINVTYANIEDAKLFNIVNDLVSGECNPLDNLNFDVTKFMKGVGFTPSEMTPDSFYRNLIVYLSEEEITNITNMIVMSVITSRESA